MPKVDVYVVVVAFFSSRVKLKLIWIQSKMVDRKKEGQNIHSLSFSLCELEINKKKMKIYLMQCCQSVNVGSVNINTIFD